MARIKPFDDDDMSNFAFDRHDENMKSDEELLDDWNTEGPEDEEGGKPKRKKDDDDLDEPLDSGDDDDR